MGHVITFAQQKGGAGKTTVLAHLAAAWAEAGRTVAVIDLDPQQSLTRWAGLRPIPAIDADRVQGLPCGGRHRAARKAYDFVLVDCPGAASSLLENAMRESDLVLAPCQPSVMDVWALESGGRDRGEAEAAAADPAEPDAAAARDLDEVLAALGPSRALLLATQLGNRNASRRRCSTADGAGGLAGGRRRRRRSTGFALSSARCCRGCDGGFTRERAISRVIRSACY